LRRYTRILLTTIGAASVITAGAAYLAYAADMSKIRERVGTGSQVIQTSAGQIEYATFGEGIPVLISHGGGGGYDQGLIIARENVRDGLRVIAPSRFGYLKTPLPLDGASPAAQADAHAALLDALDVDRVVVIGFSAGARSAIELALRHPTRVASLILISPITYSPSERPEVDSTATSRAVLKVMLAGADFAYWSALHIARPSVVRFAGVSPDLEAQAPKAERERVDEILRAMLPLSQRIAGIRIDGSTPLTPWPLERITAPTLVVAAADDLFNTLPAAQFTAAHMPNAKLISLSSGGHLLVGRHEQVRRELAAFLAQNQLRRAPQLAP